MIKFKSGNENEAQGTYNGKPFGLYVGCSNYIIVTGDVSETEYMEIVSAWRDEYVYA